MPAVSERVRVSHRTRPAAARRGGPARGQAAEAAGGAAHAGVQRRVGQIFVGTEGKGMSGGFKPITMY